MVDTNTKAMIIEMQRILATYTEGYIEDLEKTKDEEARTLLTTQYRAKRDLLIDVYTGVVSRSAPIDHYTPQKFSDSAKHSLGIIDRNISTSSAGERLKSLAVRRKKTFLDRLVGST